MSTLRTSTSLGLLVVALLVGSVLLARTDGTDGGEGSAGSVDSTGERTSVGVVGEDRAIEATTTGQGPTSTTRPPATGLDPGLVAAFERARQAAADAGHTLVINSGYRTPERQQQLLDEEVAERGSFEEASRWVFPPDRSMHVQGLAVDVGDGPAADWLDANGAAYGICHTLAWEWWHFEWRARWEASGTCPPEAQDPAEAPGS